MRYPSPSGGGSSARSDDGVGTLRRDRRSYRRAPPTRSLRDHPPLKGREKPSPYAAAFFRSRAIRRSRRQKRPRSGSG